MTQQRWGITVPFAGVPLHEHREWFEELVDLGYTDIWSSEAGAHDAFTVLALAAAWTTDAAARPGRRPRLHAWPGAARADRSRASIEAAPGRVAVGIGTSSNVIVERWNGIPFERPYHHVRDTLRFLRAALTGEKVTEDYDTFAVKGFRLGVRVDAAAADPRRRAAARDAAARRPRGRRRDHQLARRADDVRTVAPIVGAGQGDRRPHLRAAERGPRRGAPPRPADDRRVPERAGLRRVPRVARPRRAARARCGTRGRPATGPARPRRSPTRSSTQLIVSGSPEQCAEHVQRYVDNGRHHPGADDPRRPGPHQRGHAGPGAEVAPLRNRVRKTRSDRLHVRWSSCRPRPAGQGPRS